MSSVECPAEALAKLLGKKWIPQIIEQLYIQPCRFGELSRKLAGSSSKMLKQQLTMLELQQIVENYKITENNQVYSYYQLTEKGQHLFHIVAQMKAWGMKNLKCE